MTRSQITALSALLISFVFFYVTHDHSYLEILSTQNRSTFDQSLPAADEVSGKADLFQKGQFYFNQNNDLNGVYDRNKARYYYEQALQADPTGNSLSWYQLGRIDFIEGKFEAALFKFDKQIEYFGDQVPNVYYMIGLTYGYKARQSGESADWEKGAEGFATFLEYVPTSPWARTDLAWIYFAQGKYEEMLPVLEVGLESHPNHPWLNNMYGLALLNTDQPAEAREHFELAKREAAQLTPQDWGRAYPGNDPKDWVTGLSSFREAIEKNIALVSE